MFLIQDEKGTVFNRVKNPAAVFDRESGTLHKIGEKENMVATYNFMQDKYRSAGLYDIADDLTLIDLPKDQVEINRVFQITGYIKRLYEEATADERLNHVTDALYKK